MVSMGIALELCEGVAHGGGGAFEQETGGDGLADSVGDVVYMICTTQSGACLD